MSLSNFSMIVLALTLIVMIAFLGFIIWLTVTNSSTN